MSFIDYVHYQLLSHSIDYCKALEIESICMYMYVCVFIHAALDLQSCGVTTEGASHFQEVLKLNATLIVLDLRANALLGMDSAHIHIEY